MSEYLFTGCSGDMAMWLARFTMWNGNGGLLVRIPTGLSWMCIPSAITSRTMHESLSAIIQWSWLGRSLSLKASSVTFVCSSSLLASSTVEQCPRTHVISSKDAMLSLPSSVIG